MVQLLFIWVGLRIGFADALRNHFWVALLVAGIFAVLALHPRRVLEELPT